MNDEAPNDAAADIVFLPVTPREQELLRWVRLSRFRDDPDALRDLLTLMDEQGVDPAAVRAQLSEAEPDPWAGAAPEPVADPLGVVRDDEPGVREVWRAPEAAADHGIVFTPVVEEEVGETDEFADTLSFEALAPDTEEVPLEDDTPLFSGADPVLWTPGPTTEPVPESLEPVPEMGPEIDLTPPHAPEPTLIPAGEAAEETAMAVTVDDKLVSGATPRDFLEAVIRHLLAQGKLRAEHLPVRTSQRKYLLAVRPLHPSGRKFVDPIQVDDLWIEADRSPRDILRAVTFVLDGLSVPFEVVTAPSE